MAACYSLVTRTFSLRPNPPGPEGDVCLVPRYRISGHIPPLRRISVRRAQMPVYLSLIPFLRGFGIIVASCPNYFRKKFVFTYITILGNCDTHILSTSLPSWKTFCFYYCCCYYYYYYYDYHHLHYQHYYHVSFLVHWFL
jgi:hypothetical protein